MHRPLIAAAAIAAILGLGLPAAADCMGPTVEYAGGEVVRGDVIRITGVGFGDNCYDTGPPPPGQGALGHPLGDIVISIDQEGRSVVVAEGRADSDYEFSVDVMVPVDLEPGPAFVSVTWGAGAGAPFMENRELTVTDAPALVEMTEVLSFGRGDAVPGAPGALAEEPDSSGMAWTAWLPVVILTVVAAAVWVGFVWSGRRPTR